MDAVIKKNCDEGFVWINVSNKNLNVMSSSAMHRGDINDNKLCWRHRGCFLRKALASCIC